MAGSKDSKARAAKARAKSMKAEKMSAGNTNAENAGLVKPVNQGWSKTTVRLGSNGSDSAPSLAPVRYEPGAATDLEPLAESVRYILARPQFGVDNDLPPLIAVVAALPGEGVTTVSSMFSAVLSSDFGVETCRVDLSWSSASRPGVFDVVMGTADLEDVLEWDGPAATLHSGAVSQVERHRLARSEELDKLITMLTSRFQHVILDLPAILSGSEGLEMMRLADSYLLVVKHGVTTLQQVQLATEQLSDFETLGSVLNNVRTRTPRPLSRWLAG